MTPQTSAFLDKSRELLAQADKMLEVGPTEATNAVFGIRSNQVVYTSTIVTDTRSAGM